VSVLRLARITALLIWLGVSSAVSSAQTEEPPAPGLTSLTAVSASAPVVVLTPAPPSDPSIAPAPDRANVLVPLYGSFVVLQALDFDSTMKALQSGAGREANVAMQAVVGSPVLYATLKAGATAAIILTCERLRKRNHGVAAAALMIGLDSAYAVVSARNYAISRRVH
jgi:hypothetical protein